MGVAFGVDSWPAAMTYIGTGIITAGVYFAAKSYASPGVEITDEESFLELMEDEIPDRRKADDI